jgi:hypothetical protein
MKRTILLLPLIMVAGFAGYLWLHPGVSQAEPRFQDARPTRLATGSTQPLPDGTMGASDEVTVRIFFEATLDK